MIGVGFSTKITPKFPPLPRFHFRFASRFQVLYLLIKSIQNKSIILSSFHLFIQLPPPLHFTLVYQSGRVVKAYEYYQTCIATKTFEFFGFLSEARNDTPNLTACCTNVPFLNLLKIGHLCSSFVQVFPQRMIFNLRQRSLTTRWAKQKTCKMDVTVKKWFTFDIKFLIFSTWSRCAIYVMKKYRVSATNVPIFIEIRSGDKIRSIIFERSYGLQTVKLPRWRKRGLGATGKASSYRAKTNLDHNKCIKTQMKI